MGHANTKKHKASHGGYNSKPTQKAVRSLMDLYAGCSILLEVKTPVIKEVGVQLKFF